MGLPTLNTGLLRDLLIWASQDEEFFANAEKYLNWGEWDQGVWGRELRNGVCKSSYCQAGQAVIQTGWGLNYQWDQYAGDTEFEVFTAESCAPLVPVIDPGTGEVEMDKFGKPKMCLDDREILPVSARAREVLGLSDDEASWYFDGDNEIGDLVNMALWFAKRRRVDLDLPADLMNYAGTSEKVRVMKQYANA